MDRIVLILGFLAVGGQTLAAQLGPHDCASPPSRECRDAAKTLVRGLDLASFPNSTGPRRMAGKHTLADYGFTKVQVFDDGWTEASEPDGSWSISLYLLHAEPRLAEVCLTDVAHNGGTYRATSLIEAAPGAGGLWRATGRKLHSDACRETAQ